MAITFYKVTAKLNVPGWLPVHVNAWPVKPVPIDDRDVRVRRVAFDHEEIEDDVELRAPPAARRARVAQAFTSLPAGATSSAHLDGLLRVAVPRETDFPSKKALREHLAAYMRSWNEDPTFFAWTKPANAIMESHRRLLDRISTAVQ